jgi:pilus assembly protein CpaE
MARARTCVWASDDAPNRELIEATASELGLQVRFCTLRELDDATREGRDELVGVEVGSDPAQTQKLVSGLRARLPHAGILVASSDGSVGFIRHALQVGANDVLSLPLHMSELHKAFIRSAHAAPRAAAAQESLGEVITVCSARGGLGATTLAVNLASKLAAIVDDEVALVDLDLQRGDVAAFMNLTPHNTLANLATAHGEVDEVFLAGTLTRHANGVFVLPAPTEIEEADSVGHDEVKVALDLLRARFRYTVVDTARTITGATLAAFEASHRVLVVTDLSIPGVRAARRTVELLSRLGVPGERVELIVTEAIPGPVSMKDGSQAIGKTPFFVIPRDEPSAAEAMNHGAPLNGKPSKLALAMAELAAKVAGVTAAGKPRGGQMLRRLFGRSQGVQA